MKKIIAIIIIMLLLAPSMLVLAEEGQVKQGPIVGAVKTVGVAAQGTAETAASPIMALGQNEPGKVVSDPIEKGGKTVYDTAKNTAETVTLEN